MVELTYWTNRQVLLTLLEGSDNLLNRLVLFVKIVAVGIVTHL